jgi:hypothetical protein
MSDNEIMKVPKTVLDGFDFNTDEQQIRRVIQGLRYAFTNDFTWVDSNDEEVPRNREHIVVDRVRVLQEWGADQTPVGEPRFLEPTEKWPDVETLNNAEPKSKWREGPDGKLRGPWACQWVIYLLDPLTLDKFSYPTNTTGGHIAVGELSNRIKDMRRLRGEHVYPVVTLGDTFMNTRFGGRQRPHFEVKRWIKLGGESGQVEALPPPSPPPKSANESAPQPAVPLNEIKEPSLAEEMDDEIPDFESEKAEGPKAVAPPLPNSRRNLKKPPAKTSTKATGKRRLTNLDAG